MNPVEVAILGCGPAGLLAAHAVILKGHDVDIFSVKQKSIMPGTQYLHEPIPHLSPPEPDGQVRYIKRGTQQGYAMKVYGSPDAPCSWTKFQEGQHNFWNLTKTYDELWNRFEDAIIDSHLDALGVQDVRQIYPLVISSVPAPRICANLTEHNFDNQTVFINDEIPRDVEIRDNMVVYNGRTDEYWYRASLIDGKAAIETAQQRANWRYGRKPISTDCDCHLENGLPNLGHFCRVGRFGKWEKGVLSHNAFWDTLDIMDKTIGKGERAVL